MGDHWEFVEGFAGPLGRSRGVCIFGVGRQSVSCVMVGYHDCERVFVFVTCCSMSCFIDFVGCVLWVVCVVVVTIKERFTVLKSNQFLQLLGW